MRERNKKGWGSERRRFNRVIRNLFGVKHRRDVEVDRALNKVVELSDKVDALVFELYRVNPTNPMFNEIRDRHPATYAELVKFARTRKLPWRPNYLGDVGDFHFKFQVPMSERPTIPYTNLIDFRLRLLRAEFRELELAVTPQLQFTGGPINLAEVLDALVDLTYVVIGTVHTFGLGGVFGEAWRRVHEANLKKVLAGGKSSSDGYEKDVVKPEGWKHPKLDDLVRR